MGMVVYFEAINRGLSLVLLGVMPSRILSWDIGREDLVVLRRREEAWLKA